MMGPRFELIHITTILILGLNSNVFLVLD